jgi:hypothetical protein
MNFLVAGIAWLLLARFKLPEGTRLLTVLIFALNAMWGSGYFLYSAVLDIGDLAGALHGLHANPMWAWRIALGLTGAWLYRGTMRFIAPQLPPRVPLLIAYGSAGAVAVLSALLARAEMLASIREALLESLVASLGLLYLSFARQSPESTAAVSEAAPSARWFAIAGTPIVIAFLLLLGPGIRAT